MPRDSFTTENKQSVNSNWRVFVGLPGEAYLNRIDFRPWAMTSLHFKFILNGNSLQIFIEFQLCGRHQACNGEEQCIQSPVVGKQMVLAIQVSVTEYHGQGGLKNRNFFITVLEAGCQ